MKFFKKRIKHLSIPNYFLLLTLWLCSITLSFKLIIISQNIFSKIGGILYLIFGIVGLIFSIRTYTKK